MSLISFENVELLENNPLDEMLELGNRDENEVIGPSKSVETIKEECKVVLPVGEKCGTFHMECPQSAPQAAGVVFPVGVAAQPRKLMIIHILASNEAGLSGSVNAHCSQIPMIAMENFDAHAVPTTASEVAQGEIQPTTSHTMSNCVGSYDQAQKPNGETMKKRRAKRKPVPDDQKDLLYYERRAKNNEAARRSRKTKKLNESRSRLDMLIKQNDELMEKALEIRKAQEELRRDAVALGIDINKL